MCAANGPRQFTLDLPHLVGSELSDFLPAACNREALEAVLAWPRWPGPVLVLHGPEASGKTHLARIWARRAGALVVPAASPWLGDELPARVAARPVCLVDDADEAEDEAMLFHLHNEVAARRGSLLLTGREPPSRWLLGLPDLASRLRSAWAVAIRPPDDELLAALLVKQFADRQLRVDRDVIAYLVPRMERSFAAAARLVQALDRASLRASRPISLALARDVLRSFDETGPAEPTIGSSPQTARLL